MRKNFLLLFLMALLPLAGWADNKTVKVDAAEFSVDYGKANPTLSATMLSWTIVGGGDASSDLKTAVVAKLQYTTTRTPNSDVSSSNTFTVSLISESDNTVTVSSDNYTIVIETATANVYVTKATDATAPAVGAETAPVAQTTTLYYDTTAQELLSDKGTGSVGEVTGLALEYKVDDGDWSDDCKATTAAEHTIKYRVKETANYSASTEVTLTNGKKIEKGTPIVSLDPSIASTFKYDGTDHAICTEGTATLGATLSYQLKKKNGDDWSNSGDATTDATTIQVKDAGTYKVAVSFAGNDNLNTITESETNELIVSPATLSVEATATRVYDGEAGWSSLAQNNVTPSYVGWQGTDETTIGVAGITIGEDAYSLVDETVKNAGAHSFISVDKTKFSISDNSNYTFYGKSTGKLTITKAAVPTITFSNELTKDKGKTPTLDEVKNVLTVDGGAIESDKDAIKAAVTAFTIGDEADADGKYTVTLTVDTDADVFGNYNMDTFAAGTGKIKYNNATLYISLKTASQSKLTKVYDGEEVDLSGISADDFDIEGWVAGDETDLTISASFAAEGEHKNVANYILNFNVTGVPAGYETEISSATFKVTKRPLTVTLPIQNVEAGNNADDTLEDLVTDGISITNWVDEEPENAYTLSLKAGLTTDADSKLTDQTAADGYILTLAEGVFANYGIGEDLAKSISGKLVVGTGGGDVTEITNFASITAIDQETRDIKINFKNRTRRPSESSAYHPWKAEKWNALILPFEITVAELSNVLGFATTGNYNYVVVNTIKKNSASGKFQFQLAMGTIPANTPIMVKTVTDMSDATPDGDKFITFSQKKIEAPASATVEAVMDNGFKLVGKYDTYTLTAENTEYNESDEGLQRFQLGDNDDNYRWITKDGSSTWDIVPFDCYVDLSGNAEESRNVVFEFEEPNGNVTAITSVSVDLSNASTNAQGWYNLNGLKLQTAPTQKGVYIKDGKKYVVK